MIVAVIGVVVLATLATAQPVPNFMSKSDNERVLVDASFGFKGEFDASPGSAEGYGPFLDIMFPPSIDASGASFTTPPIPGRPVSLFELTAESPCITHPFHQTAPGVYREICGEAGATFVTFTLPFASFFPSQPAVAIQADGLKFRDPEVTAVIEEVVAINVTSYFRYGATAADDVATDPVIGPGFDVWYITPAVYTLTSKVGANPPVGPSFPHKLEVEVDIADGYTLTSIAIDQLFLPAPGLVDITGSAVTVGTGGMSLPAAVGPGTVADKDLAFEVDFYFPCTELRASAPLLDPITGVSRTFPLNTTQLSGFVTINGTVAATSASSEPGSLLKTPFTFGHTKAEIVENVGLDGYSPGDVVEYTLPMVVSDCYAFDALVFTETMPDGQTFLQEATTPGRGPTITGGSGPLTVGNSLLQVNTSDVGFDTDTSTSGSTIITFHVSDAMLNLASVADGVLVGPLGTTITFYALINDKFTDSSPGLNDPILHLQVLETSASMVGRIVDRSDTSIKYNTLAASDGTSLQIAVGSVELDIIGIDGVVCDPLPCVKGFKPLLPVTFRMRYTLPSTDFDSVLLESFLPVPLFDISDVDANMPSAFVEGSGPSADLPALGFCKFGFNDTFYGLDAPATKIVPTVTTNVATNLISFNYPSPGYSSPMNNFTTMELYFTTRITGAPYPDADFIVVLGQSTETSFALSSAQSTSQLSVEQPLLVLTTGILDTNSAEAYVADGNGAKLADGVTQAGLAPFDFARAASSLCPAAVAVNTSRVMADPLAGVQVYDVDGGDLVAFSAVVHNRGRGDAYDVVLGADLLPVVFEEPSFGHTLCVTDGTGNPVPYTGSFFSTTPGITLTNPIPAGKDSDGAVIDDGSNMVVVTYVRAVPDNVVVGAVAGTTDAAATIPERAEATRLLNYASGPGGDNFVGSPNIADAGAQTDSPPMYASVRTTTTLNVGIASTNVAPAQYMPGWSGMELPVAVGELVTFNVSFELPEGDNRATILELKSVGGPLLEMLYVNLTGVGASLSFPDLTPSDAASVLAAAVSPVPVTSTLVPETMLTLDFGSVINTPDGGITADDWISLEVTAVVRSEAAIVAGASVSPSLRASLMPSHVAQAREDTPHNVTTPSPDLDLTLVEPLLEVAYTFDRVGSTSEDAGSVLAFALTVTHATTSTGPAFNVILAEDFVRGGGFGYLELVPGTVWVDAAGTATVTSGNNGGDSTVNVVVDAFRKSDAPVVVHFEARLTDAVYPKQNVAASAGVVGYDSLPRSLSSSGVYHESAAMRSYVGVFADTSLVVAEPTVSIGVVATSVAETGFVDGGSAGDADVAIGEKVTLVLNASLVEGSYGVDMRLALSPNPSDGALHVLSVEIIGAPETGFTASNYTAALAAGPAALAASPLDVTSDSSSDSGPLPSGDGLADTVRVRIGNVVVTGDNVTSAAEYNDVVSVRVVGLVLPLGSVDQDDVITIAGAVDYYVPGVGMTTASAETVAVDVVEPSLNLGYTNSKASAPGTTDAGDVVIFELSVAHTGTGKAPGFNVTIIEDFAAGGAGDYLELVPGSVSVVHGSASSVVRGNDGGDGQVIVVLDTFALGAGPSTIIYHARVTNATYAAQTMTQTASMVYQSIPASDGDRSYVRDYGPVTAATSVVTASPSTSVSLGSTSLGETLGNKLAIGEEFVVRFETTLVEGRYELGAELAMDGIDAEQIEVLSVAVVNLSSATFSSAVDVTSDAASDTRPTGSQDGFKDTVSVDFGFVDVAGDNIVSAAGFNDVVVVEVTARLIDAVDNSNGGTFTLDAKSVLTPVDQSAPATVSSASLVLEVEEPSLALAYTNSKVSLPGTTDAGDTVSFTLSVDGVLPGTAYNVTVIEDFSRSGGYLRLVPGSVAVTHAGGSSVVLGNGGSDETIQVVLDVVSGSSPLATISYSAVVNDAAYPAQGIEQAAVAHFQSLPTISVEAGRGNVRDYPAVGATTAFVTDEPSTSVAIVSTSLGETALVDGGAPDVVDVSIGENVTVVLNVTLVEGSYEVDGMVNLTSAAGLGLIVIHDIDLVGAPSAGFTPSAFSAALSSGPSALAASPVSVLSEAGREYVGDDGEFDSVLVEYGAVLVAGDNVVSAIDYNDVLGVAITFSVLDTGAAVLNNSLSLGAGVRYRSFDGLSDGVVTGPSVSFEVVEPEVGVVSVSTNTSSDLDSGDAVGVQVVLAHTAASRAPAYDLVMVFPAPAGMQFVPDSVMLSNGPGDVTYTYAANLSSVTIRGFNSLDGWTRDEAELVLDAVLTLTDGVEEGASYAIAMGSVTTSSAPAAEHASTPRSYAVGGSGLAANAVVSARTEGLRYELVVAENDHMASGRGLNPSLTASSLSIGESVVFNATLYAMEGTTRSAKMVVRMPSVGSEGMELRVVAASVAHIGSDIDQGGMTLGVGSSASATTVSDAVFEFGDVVVRGTNALSAPGTVAPVDGIQVVVAAVVTGGSPSINAAGDAGDATLYYPDAPPASFSSFVVAGLDIYYAEHHVSALSSRYGYTLKASHDSGAIAAGISVHAYNVTLVTTTLPSDLTFVESSVVVRVVDSGVTTATALDELDVTVVSGNSAADRVVEVHVPVLAFGSSLEVDFAVAVDSDVADFFVTNVSASYASLPHLLTSADVTHAEIRTYAVDATSVVDSRTAEVVHLVATGTSLTETGMSAFNTSLPDVVAGERIDFEVSVVVGPGQHSDSWVYVDAQSLGGALSDAGGVAVSFLDLPSARPTVTSYGPLIRVGPEVLGSVATLLDLDSDGVNETLGFNLGFVELDDLAEGTAVADHTMTFNGSAVVLPVGPTGVSGRVIELQARAVFSSGVRVAATPLEPVAEIIVPLLTINATASYNRTRVAGYAGSLLESETREQVLDGGDFVLVTLDVGHNVSHPLEALQSQSTAYNAVVSYPVPAGLELVPNSVVVTTNGAQTSSGVVASGNGANDGSVTVTLTSVGPPGPDAGVQVSFLARVRQDGSAGRFPVDASVSYGSAPGGSELVSYSRADIDTDATSPELAVDHTPLNVTLQIGSSADPTTVGGALAIGEQVVLEAEVVLREGDYDLKVNVSLGSADWEIVDAYVASYGVGMSSTAIPATLASFVGVSTTANAPVSGETSVTFDFGEMSVAGNNEIGDERLVVAVVARLADESVNSNGAVKALGAVAAVSESTTNGLQLVPSGRAQYGLSPINGGVTGIGSLAVGVVAPELVSTMMANITTGNAGEPLQLQFAVRHTTASTATAHNVSVTLDMPAGMDLLPGTAVIVVDPQFGPVSAVVEVDEAQKVRVVFDALVLAPGAFVNVTFDAQFTTDVAQGSILQVPASVDYQTSAAAAGTRVLDGSTVFVIQTFINGFEVTLELDSSSVAETSGGALNVGENATFVGYLRVPEGKGLLVANISFPDVFQFGSSSPSAPASLRIVEAYVASVGGQLSVSKLGVSALGSVSTDGLVAMFDFGTTTNVGDNQVTSDDFVTIAVVAQVVDDGSYSVAGRRVNATLSGAYNGTSFENEFAEVRVVEPELVMDHVYAGFANVTAGSIVSVTTTIRYDASSGSGPGFGLLYNHSLVADEATAMLSLIPGSVSVSGELPGGVSTLATPVVFSGNGGSDTAVVIGMEKLEPGPRAGVEFFNVTYQLLVTGNAPSGARLEITPPSLSVGSLPLSGFPGRCRGNVAVNNDAAFASVSEVSIESVRTFGLLGVSGSLAVGEPVTYEVVVRIPEGVTYNMSVAVAGYDASNLVMLNASVAGWSAALDGVADEAGSFSGLGAGSESVTFAPFSTIVNNDRDGATAETVTLRFVAVPVAGASDGAEVALPTAVVQYAQVGPSVEALAVADAAAAVASRSATEVNGLTLVTTTGDVSSGFVGGEVTIREPKVEVLSVVGTHGNDVVVPGEVVTYTVTIGSEPDRANATAWDIVATLGAGNGMRYVDGSFSLVSGVGVVVAGSSNATGANVTFAASGMGIGSSSVFEVKYQVADDAAAGQVVTSLSPEVQYGSVALSAVEALGWYDIASLRREYSASSVVHETVNSPPIAVDDVVIATEFQVSYVNVSANDGDVDGNLYPETITLLTAPAWGATVEVVSDEARCGSSRSCVAYRPPDNFFGRDDIQYQTCDSRGACSVAWINVTVAFGVDAEPVLKMEAYSGSVGPGWPAPALDDLPLQRLLRETGEVGDDARVFGSYIVSENVDVEIASMTVLSEPGARVPSWTGFRVSVVDPDLFNVVGQVRLVAANGTVAFGSTTGLVSADGTSNGESVVVFDGQGAAVNASLATLVFTPTPGFVGLTWVSIEFDDRSGTGGGGPHNDSVVVVFDVVGIETIPEQTILRVNAPESGSVAGDAVRVELQFVDQFGRNLTSSPTAGGAPLAVQAEMGHIGGWHDGHTVSPAGGVVDAGSGLYVMTFNATERAGPYELRLTMDPDGPAGPAAPGSAGLYGSAVASTVRINADTLTACEGVARLTLLAASGVWERYDVSVRDQYGNADPAALPGVGDDWPGTLVWDKPGDADFVARSSQAADGGLVLEIRYETSSSAAPGYYGFAIVTNATSGNCTMRGNFLARSAAPQIVAVVGRDDGEVDEVNDDFTVGDTVTVVFDMETNAPFAGNKVAIDALLNFSTPLGANYSGVWTSPATNLTITIHNTSIAADQRPQSEEPVIGVLVVETRVAGVVRAGDGSDDVIVPVGVVPILGKSNETKPCTSMATTTGDWGEGRPQSNQDDDIITTLIGVASTPVGILGIVAAATVLILLCCCCCWLVVLCCRRRRPLHGVWLNPPTHTAVRSGRYMANGLDETQGLDMSVLVAPSAGREAKRKILYKMPASAQKAVVVRESAETKTVQTTNVSKSSKRRRRRRPAGSSHVVTTTTTTATATPGAVQYIYEYSYTTLSGSDSASSISTTTQGIAMSSLQESGRSSLSETMRTEDLDANLSSSSSSSSDGSGRW
ncbi:uncharacterized protein AMSG_09866 [Thecamonas trahens ATCC 50062]|uniref:Uncharacterized protein n=1 Tax=Thecamonas trahens ATCC 50062 TaxID=461836 RepID=A0A0L0DR42_THETB|nr:hypothetical protein AMSG_09866 [Thecamonas trahens ATCC 50062]KNC53903.1 hypothetical protein AMSG_09866 [Thecamonas trahens ATCC 50062]|eukprot:XP_013754276.1 hypothetical protein AMSG_09866 [Thecamonas trahens ATCC 50062]